MVYMNSARVLHFSAFIVFLCQVPPTLEIGLVPVLTRGQYPGLFLMTSPARMVRPVLNLSTNTTEMIGSFEQV